ncbi:MAG: hypothetical protein DCC73_07235 [Proteobacteria bacterium]|nr:MAG: hypothetical protein DCC73_07235 [Pseudomonadota bacterium]
MSRTNSLPTGGIGRFLTIRNSIFAIVGFLVTAVVVISTTSVIDALNERRAAQQVTQDSRISQYFLKAARYWSIERGVTNTALNSQEPASVQFLARIKEARETADVAYQAAMTEYRARPDFAGKAELLAEIEKKHADYLAQQSVADRNMLATAAEREKRVDRNFYKAASDLIVATQRARTAAEFDHDNDANVAAYQQLNHALWVMSESADQEWAVIGANMASGETLSGIRLELLANYRGALESSWETVKSITNSSLVAAELKPLVAEVDQKFFGAFQQTREDVYAAAQVQEPYPMTAIEWIDQATAATASLMSLSSAAADEMMKIADQHTGQATSTFFIDGFIVAVSVVLGLASFWFVAQRIVKPLNSLSDVMAELAAGNLDIAVTGAGRSDEVGKMAQSVQVFKDNAKERLRLEAERKEAEERAHRAKEEEAERRHQEEEAQRRREEEREAADRQHRRQEMLSLADKFEQSVMQLVSAVSAAADQMEQAAQGMTEVAADTSRQSSTVAKASEQASANIQMVASAAEQLSASVKEISGQVSQSTEYARNAVSDTERASEEIKQLVAAAQKIGDVVNLISDIASQTNLLALNATIEAARAGEAGKGFAVVASEVKNLASQTATATEEITAQVTGMQTATEAAVKAIRGISEVIKRIDETASSIAVAVEEQDASTHEIARNVSEVSSGTQEVTTNIAVVNEGAATTGKAAHEVLTSAREVARQTVSLRQQVEAFLSQIRAA